MYMGKSMKKRYYYSKQKITVKKFLLSITTNGIVYHCTYHGYIKLDSLWQPKIGILSVSLPDDTTVKLKPTKDRIEEVKEENQVDK